MGRIDRNAPAFFVARHYGPPLTITAGQMRRHIILWADRYRKAATHGITA